MSRTKYLMIINGDDDDNDQAIVLPSNCWGNRVD